MPNQNQHTIHYEEFIAIDFVIYISFFFHHHCSLTVWEVFSGLIFPYLEKNQCVPYIWNQGPILTLPAWYIVNWEPKVPNMCDLLRGNIEAKASSRILHRWSDCHKTCFPQWFFDDRNVVCCVVLEILWNLGDLRCFGASTSYWCAVVSICMFPAVLVPAKAFWDVCKLGLIEWVGTTVEL